LIDVCEKRTRGTRGEQGIHAACGVPVSGFALASAKTGRFPPPPPNWPLFTQNDLQALPTGEGLNGRFVVISNSTAPANTFI